MTEHIDGNRLHQDLRYRFEYLSKFLNFTLDDIKNLNDLAPVIFPRIPVIVDTVYRKLFSFDITKQYFLVRNEDFSSKKQGGLTLESAQMELRKDMLSMYLKRILTQREWNDAFLQYLSQVGKIHTNQTGSSSINVDYMHINALLGYLEHLLIDLLWKAENVEEKIRHNMIMTINKFFWIQNDFFTMHYMMAIKYTIQASSVIKTEPHSCCLFK